MLLPRDVLAKCVEENLESYKFYFNGQKIPITSVHRRKIATCYKERTGKSINNFTVILLSVITVARKLKYKYVVKWRRNKSRPSIFLFVNEEELKLLKQYLRGKKVDIYEV